MPGQPLFIGSEIYRASSYGRKHPLAIPRVSTAIDLSRAMGWLPDAQYVDSPMATVAQLARFHDLDYITAIQDAERDQRLDAERRALYHLGKIDNPIFPEIFRRPATAAGGSILAAELLADGGIVYSPAGGTHHGRPDRASGFCYFNDPALGILAMLDLGLERIYYVDVDAHHGDGVQDAFAEDDRVLTVSVHEGARWPYTGAVEDRAGGMARNVPVPEALNDSEMDVILERVLLPLGQAFRPQAVVLQCGADALADDPLSRLSLSNRALWRVVSAMRDLAPRCLVLGGGGYNPWTVGRCWAGVWAVLNDIDPPEAAPAAEPVLRGLSWHRAAGKNPPGRWLTTIADEPRSGPVRDEILAVIECTLRS